MEQVVVEGDQRRGNKIKMIHLAPFLLLSLFYEGDWKRHRKAIVFSNFQEDKSSDPSGKAFTIKGMVSLLALRRDLSD